MNKAVVEIIHEELEKYENVIIQSVNNKIFCKCDFCYKDKLKELGFKWDPLYKLWYIEKDKLTQEIFNKSMGIKYVKGIMGPKRKYLYYVTYISKLEIDILAKDIIDKGVVKCIKKIERSKYLF